MKEKTFKFTGKPSGDRELFCWDVSKEDFVNTKGEQPDEYDGAIFTKGRYRIYFEDLLSEIINNKKFDYEFEITIKAKKVGE